MRRREFVQSAGRAAAGLTILPSGTLFSQTPPSSKLNVALIGVWGRGTAHYNWLKTENVVAVCDVNETRLQEGVKIFPGASTYTDWRRLLDQKDVESIVICTPDHHHAFIANWAMNRDLRGNFTGQDRVGAASDGDSGFVAGSLNRQDERRRGCGGFVR